MAGDDRGAFVASKIALLNKNFAKLVLTLPDVGSELERFHELTRLLLEQRESLSHEATFLTLVSVVKVSSQLEEPVLATQLSPKNVILLLLEILRHFIDTFLPGNEIKIRNVLELLIFIFSLGPPLPPVDRYFDTGPGGGAPRYDKLIKNVQSLAQLYQTDEFLNAMSVAVTSVCETGSDLIGGLPWADLAIQACRLTRGYDPLMRHFDTPVANLFRLPISRLSRETTDSHQLELTLRLVAACPSLFIDLDEPPQPKLSTLLSLLSRTHSHLSVCLSMTSCLYRLFTVSELTLDACLDESIIAALCEEIAFMVRSYVEGEGARQLVRMLFQLLKFMNGRDESKIIIAGQPSVVKECINVIQACRFESVLAVAFLNSMSAYLLREDISSIIRAISHCCSNVEAEKEFLDYFHSVSLQLLVLHSLDEQEEPSDTLDAKEFMEFSSRSIIGLTDGSFLKLGLNVYRILLDYPGIHGIISKEFIGAFTKLFLESVRRHSEDLIIIVSYLLCGRILPEAPRDVVGMVRESEIVPLVLKLFISEERMLHWRLTFKDLVASYQRVGLEFNELKDRDVVSKLLSLLYEHCANQDQEPADSEVDSLISILWTFSCDPSYYNDAFLCSLTIDKLVEVIGLQLRDIPYIMKHSYIYRGSAHILTNLCQRKETAKLMIAETGLASSLSQVLIQLTKQTPVPWRIVDATIRLADTITADEIYKLELIEKCQWTSVLVDIMMKAPGTKMPMQVMDSLNACASISVEHRHSICTPGLLGYCIDLLKQTSDGRLFCICCCLLATLADTQLGARYISHFDIFSYLLSVRGDSQLLESCIQVSRWGQNLMDKVFLCCVTVPPDISPQTLGQRTGLGQLREENFVVDRMLGLIRQGCMNCEAGERSSCTQSESRSAEEICIFASCLSINQYQQLVNRGWYRRGGDRMYRWGTKLRRGCVDWETRVRVREFSLKQRKSFSRVLKRIPVGLTIDTVPARFSEEGYTLYNEYNLYKHDKPRISKESYIEHVVDTCVPTVLSGVEGLTYGTFHQEYRVAGELIAIGVIDIIPEGVMSIYFYYKMSKQVTRLSLGKYSSLREIQLVQQLGELRGDMRYYYLQGWNGENPKLSYKGDYAPVEFMGRCVGPLWTEAPDNVALTPQSESQLRAVEVDRLEWERQGPPLSVSSIRVYVSGVLITFQQLISVAKLEPEQCEAMRSSLEELCYALGQELTAQLVLLFYTSLDIQSL